MTRYVRHKSKDGRVYTVTGELNCAWSSSAEHGVAYSLPKVEYRLCTEKGEWIPEWVDVTAACRLAWHAGLQRTVLMHGGQLVLHPCVKHRYRVALVDYGICVEERV